MIAPTPTPPNAHDASDAGRASDDDAGVAAAGHFRIYLGMAAGVGKTVAMLDEAQRRRRRGADVVVAVVECHGRPVTESLLEGLEVAPRRRVRYHGADFEEMDLAAVLARRPRVALVDELAHHNVPGAGANDKRWRDVLELLDAGIDVITTLNIQHLESMAAAVERITGVSVRERVPDWVVRRADQIELVDSSPEQLRRRMLHGNIYPADQVPRALTHFFRTENLTALRELALRFLADETEEELLGYLARYDPALAWETAERLLVAVHPDADEHQGDVIRRGARMAARAKAELFVVAVTASESRPSRRASLDELRRLTADLGATWIDVAGDDPVHCVLEVARHQRATQLVVGAARARRARLGGEASWSARLTRAAGAVGLDVHLIAPRPAPPAPGAANPVDEGR